MSDRLKRLGERLKDRLRSRPRRVISDLEPKHAAASGRPSHFPGPSEIGLDSYPPTEHWDDWSEWDAKAWPKQVERRYALVPTICFNCEAGCGLLAYIDKDRGCIQKLEGNPLHPGSRGRHCAKGPATLNQLTDPDRILHPLKRSASGRRKMATGELGRRPGRYRRPHSRRPDGDRWQAGGLSRRSSR